MDRERRWVKLAGNACPTCVLKTGNLLMYVCFHWVDAVSDWGLFEHVAAAWGCSSLSSSSSISPGLRHQDLKLAPLDLVFSPLFLPSLTLLSNVLPSPHRGNLRQGTSQGFWCCGEVWFYVYRFAKPQKKKSCPTSLHLCALWMFQCVQAQAPLCHRHNYGKLGGRIF